MVAACAALVGCISPGPRERELAETGREQVTALLESFALAMRHQEPDLLRALLSPVLKRHEVRRLESGLALASMLSGYREYELEVEEAVGDVSWREWQKEELILEVAGSSGRRQEFGEEFELLRTEGEWRIRHFTIRRPATGDAVEVPARVEAQLMPTIQRVLVALSEGEAASLHYEILPEHSRYRRPIQGWWDRLVNGAAPEAIPLIQDIMRLEQFQLAEWPEPQDVLYYEFAPPNGVTAVYELYYVWPAAGIEEPDTLRVEMTFLPDEEGWTFHLLRLRGEAIPYSQM
jgi:hypothetical protein